MSRLYIGDIRIRTLSPHLHPPPTPKGQSMSNRGRRNAVTTPPVSRLPSLHPEGAQRRTHRTQPQKHPAKSVPEEIKIIPGKKQIITEIIFPFPVTVIPPCGNIQNIQEQGISIPLTRPTTSEAETGKTDQNEHFMETTRQQKIARLLQKELSDIFQKQTRATHGTLVSVSIVRISPDLSVCRAYLSIFPSDKAKEILDNINQNAKQIRYELGTRVRFQLRIIPELRFFLDDSLDYIEHIDELLKEK